MMLHSLVGVLGLTMALSAIAAPKAPHGQADFIHAENLYLSQADERAIWRRIYSTENVLSESLRREAWETTQSIGRPLLEQHRASQKRKIASGLMTEAELHVLDALFAMVLEQYVSNREGCFPTFEWRGFSW